MEQEMEELKKAHQNLAEAYESLSQKDAEKSGTIAQLSLQLQTLRQERAFERQQYGKDVRGLKKLREDVIEICNPVINCLDEVIEDNRKHQKMLSEMTLWPIFGSSSLSSANYPSGDENDSIGDDGFQQIDKFVKNSELGVQSREKLLERKQTNVKCCINLEQADMKRVEEAETRKNELLAAMKIQEEILESHKKRFTAVQDIFTPKSTRQSSEMEEPKIELKQSTLEKRELPQSLRMSETAGNECNDARVHDSDNYTISDCISDSSNVDTVTTDPHSDTDVSNLSEIICSSTASPLFESVGKNGKILYIQKEKRKSLDDTAETSKKRRSSEFTTGADECTVTSSTESARRIEELEKENVRLKFQLNVMAKHLHTVREEFRKGNLVHVKNTVSKEEIYGSPSLVEPPPVTPITREQARVFTSVNEHHYGIFSKTYYEQSCSLATFLMYKPIGIVNPGHTFCYMNSVVQALANIPLFSLTVVCSIEGKEGSLLNALFETYKYLWIQKDDIINGSRPRPAVLEAMEIRDYYATNHGNKFDPTRQHDADEFLLDLITNLEQEVSNLDGGAGKGNLVTGLFKGYILDPDGSRDYFYTLRLSIEDQSICTVGDAFLYHLRINAEEPTQPLPATVSTNTSSPSTIHHVDDDKRAEFEVDESSAQEEESENENSMRAPQTGETDQLQTAQIMDDERDIFQISQECEETISSFEKTDDCDAKHYEDSFQNRQSVDNPMTAEFRKICAPEILCLFLDRHNADYTVNLKSLIIGDVCIPADLQAPVGTSKHASYRLMSVIKYIPGDSTQSSGHYYTCTLSQVGYACVINDESVEIMKDDVFRMRAFQGWSSILIYAKRPENLE